MNARTVTLTSVVPEGLPGPEHFSIVETPAPTEDSLVEGDLLLQVMVMSADPYLRPGIKSGEVPRPMSGFVAGRVVTSRKQGWESGDFFGASLPFSTFQVLSAEAAAKTVMWKLTGKVTEETISHGIGVLGMPGSTAYGGLIDVLRPTKAAEASAEGSAAAASPPTSPEVIWVSGSAGAVGSMVGQLAKNVFGCTVIGSCGGPAKCALVKEKFGFDEVVDYKAVEGGPSAEALTAALKKVAPDGIDMYFENVGGAHFEAAMASLRPHGRVALCGGISNYNKGEAVPERFFPMKMIYSFQRVEGFMCMPWLSGQKGKFLDDMSEWLQQGKIAVEETHFSGVDQWPLAFQSLFTGGNTGKVVVKV